MRKILVVDDDPIIAELMAARLKSNGYEVTVAANGVQAYAETITFHPDLIILDALMPVMDGYQFAQEIRWNKRFSEIPILVVSGKLQTKELFHELGIERFLIKPFDPKQLMDVVAGCLA